MSTDNPIKGGEFIIRNTKPEDIFTPEEWSEEHKMIAQTCEDFIMQEVIPHLDRIDAMEEGLMPSLMEKAGELGLLGLSVPENLGGMGVDFKTSLMATEYLGLGFSFSVAFGARVLNRFKPVSGSILIAMGNLFGFIFCATLTTNGAT